MPDRLQGRPLGSEPDRIAHESLAKAGLDQYFPHVTGHGIGLRYHEFVPMLMPGSQVVLEPGMYMSVEPGVYIPGFGGVRIEDNVLVGPDGPVPLSTPRKPW
ncbi:MAG TPA: M24 family metallopeptidase [Coriobacteriia bacterium]|nr:M24 family metallopeptidase [Coriobacteriia bacterium]